MSLRSLSGSWRLILAPLVLLGVASGATAAQAQEEPLVVNMANAPATIDPAWLCGLWEAGFVRNFYVRLMQYDKISRHRRPLDADRYRQHRALLRAFGSYQRRQARLHLHPARRVQVPERPPGGRGGRQVLLRAHDQHGRLWHVLHLRRLLRSAADQEHRSGDPDQAGDYDQLSRQERASELGTKRGLAGRQVRHRSARRGSARLERVDVEQRRRVRSLPARLLRAGRRRGAQGQSGLLQ